MRYHRLTVVPDNECDPPRHCLWLGDHPDRWTMYLAANRLTHPSERPGIHTVIYVEAA